jgi:hypothetical protein
MWLSFCSALTSESWKTLVSMKTATPSTVMKMNGLVKLFTLAVSLKKVVYRSTKNCIFSNYTFVNTKVDIADYFILTPV